MNDDVKDPENQLFTCIPTVIAAHPWKLSSEGRKQVEKGPCQNDDVIHPGVQNNNLASITQAYGETGMPLARYVEYL